MKRTLLLCLAAMLALLFAAEARPQTDPAAVSDSMIEMYKFGVLTGCRNRGREVGDPAEQVEAFCGCMIKTLNEVVSKGEWQRAIVLSLNKQEAEEMQVFTPHLPKLVHCRTKPRS